MKAGADAVEYPKGLQLYPLAETSSPRPTGGFDVTKVDGYFRGNPYFGLTSFELINEYVQNEPVQECDKVMHGILSYLGIEKGTTFAPDTATAELLDQAAPRRRSVHAGRVGERKGVPPYWTDRSWGQFRLSRDIVACLATWNLADRLDYQSRAVNFLYFAVAMPAPAGPRST